MAERLCGHEACRCEPDPGLEFCSPHCAEQRVSSPRSGQCDCGHPTCRPENVPPDQPPPEAQPMPMS